MGFLQQTLVRRAMQKVVNATVRKGSSHRPHVAGEEYYGANIVSQLHGAPKHEVWLARFLGTTMWLWVFYKAKNDGPILLGLEKPHFAHPTGESSDDDEWFESD